LPPLATFFFRHAEFSLSFSLAIAFTIRAACCRHALTLLFAPVFATPDAAAMLPIPEMSYQIRQMPAIFFATLAACHADIISFAADAIIYAFAIISYCYADSPPLIFDISSPPIYY